MQVLPTAAPVYRGASGSGGGQSSAVQAEVRPRPIRKKIEEGCDCHSALPEGRERLRGSLGSRPSQNQPEAGACNEENDGQRMCPRLTCPQTIGESEVEDADQREEQRECLECDSLGRMEKWRIGHGGQDECRKGHDHCDEPPASSVECQQRDPEGPMGSIRALGSRPPAIRALGIGEVDGGTANGTDHGSSVRVSSSSPYASRPLSSWQGNCRAGWSPWPAGDGRCEPRAGSAAERRVQSPFADTPRPPYGHAADDRVIPCGATGSMLEGEPTRNSKFCFHSRGKTVGRFR